MLTVVTNTRGGSETLERCRASVADALPQGAIHKVITIEDMETFNENRYKSSLVDELVAFVDDDDMIHPDSLRLCLEAIQSTNANLAFTDEVIVNNVDINVRSIQNTKLVTKIKTYKGIARTPLEAHHLCIMRTSAIKPIALELALRHGRGIEWLLNTSCALSGRGAVYIPFIGYYWIRHPMQRTQTHPYKIATISAISNSIRATWNVPDINIPNYLP